MNRNDEDQAAHKFLLGIYPELFSLENPKPFKIGLHRDVKAEFPAIPSRVLKSVFIWLTCRRAYLAACTEGARRYGLDGPSGSVARSEANFAAALFAKRNSRADDPWPVDREDAA